MATGTSELNSGEDLLVSTFRLGEGTFGIDTAVIQEVSMPGELTPVRHAPDYVAGIRNLRGRIITVMDLRLRLDLGFVEETPDNRILIVDWKGEPVGLLVDHVADTVAVEAGALLPPPPNLHGVQMRKLLGVFRSGDRLAALLNPDVILQDEASAAPIVPHE